MSDSKREVAAARRREVEQWLSFAEDDARVIVLCADADPPAFTVAAFHAQQAAEKILKGLLVLGRVRFRKTHDMDVLCTLTAAAYPDLQRLLDRVRSWTVWGVAFRYPGMGDAAEALPDRVELDGATETIDELAKSLRSRLVEQEKTDDA